jgi:hypothetical protein
MPLSRRVRAVAVLPAPSMSPTRDDLDEDEILELKPAVLGRARPLEAESRRLRVPGNPRP